MHDRRILSVICLVVATGACEFGEKSIGDEVAELGAESSTSTGRGQADDGGSGNVPGSSTASTTTSASSAGEASGASATVSGGEDSNGESETGDEPEPVGPDCDLGDYFAWIGMNNWTCGYTPFNENLQLTHDCILTWDGPYAALWTRPEQPAMEALAEYDVDGGTRIDWYEHDTGVITTWTCAAIVETPDCVVSPLDMCLTCVEPGTPSVVCPEE